MLQEAPNPDTFGSGWRRNGYGSDEGAVEISALGLVWLGFPAKVDVRRMIGSGAMDSRLQDPRHPVTHADSGP